MASYFYCSASYNRRVFKRNKLLHRETSQYGTYRVIDMMYNGRPSRMLFGDDKSPQSGISLDDSAELLFDYNQRFIEIVASVRPQKVLVIGGGAFSLPMAIIERFDDITVDVVEIDPVLVDISKQYFNLTNSPRLNIHVTDGRQFIEDVKSKYDLIIIDAFSGLDIPSSLVSVEAAKLYKSALSPGGAVALNFISAYHTTKPALAHRLIATFEPIFSNVEIFPAEYSARVKKPDNLILIATDGNTLQLDYFQSASI